MFVINCFGSDFGVDMDKDKVLIIAGDNACFNALNEFALSFSDVLHQRGYSPEILYIDTLDESSLQMLMKYDGRAMVGFQTNLFTLEIDPGIFMGNLIKVPMYDYILDTPTSKRQYFEPRIDGLTFCYHDDSYVDYVKTYFPHVNVIWHPPGGGVTGMEEIPVLFDNNRKYDLSFVGTYTDYRNVLQQASGELPDWAEIIYSYFDFLISNPKMSVNTAIKEFISKHKLDVASSEVPALMEILYPAEKAARSYYRERVVECIINNGVHMDVFSESWKNSPYADHPYLIIHKDIGYRDSMDIMRNSKLSLNIFSWHKASMTERIANIMLNGAVCVSDYSSRLDSLFRKDEEIILFDLNELEEMIIKIKDLLADDNKRMTIAHSGYVNAYANHRWINRVDELFD